MAFQIKSLTLYQLSFPYHFAFRPAPEEKQPSQVLWLKLETNDGITGFGEICLNHKHTLETVSSINSFLANNQYELKSKVHGLDDLVYWITQHKSIIDQNPVAFCGIETAILDAIAQYHKFSIGRLLGITGHGKNIRQTAWLKRGRPEQFMLQLSIYEQNKLSSFKVELDGNFKTDNLKLSLLSNTGYKHIQFDARNIWASADDIIDYIKHLPITPYSIENPFNKIDHDMLIELSNNQSAKVVLNEAILTTHDANIFKANSDKFVINLRLPRLGGLLRTLNMIQHARIAGFDIIIGANMGETDISLNIAKLAAIAADESLVCQEGAFDIYMLNTEMYKISLTQNSKHKDTIPSQKQDIRLQQYIKRVS
jgi:L-alanine-DL-glutamate epimerase-like enolase superfamily enzyme